ncbi:unnamed protein product (macronuclear) [Paramecium tetraurelia]|uniref:Uncharacterized protein n=1 Tax=Paramecium tetraurelia TaxID=5888 RepID=A0CW73_PARTE|nr:uncharacterized protein GSPATT00001242001 [Paramecium tetraurelia]CAK75040.1 unnamed protein product [Paramecium tetraurelia]|eukprot:XP_001442437.1 hypothetical protein (macronuclear) [Paramecium tetraurelia strain d4-2]
MKKKQQQPSQPQCQTPKSKHIIQPIASPNSNSNSFSQIFQSYYPRTPVRKVNQQKKDQLGQVMEKGVTKYAVVTQVTFNSTTKFKSLPLQEHFAQFQVYDKRNKIADNEWSLLNLKSSSTLSNKTQLFYTLTNVFQEYKQNPNNYFMISNALFLAFFSYSNQKIPYCLFITRQDALNKQLQKSQFLEQKQIESTVLGVETPLSVLFPTNPTQFPTKYTLSLIQRKHILYLFNIILNIGIEKETMDVAANFTFHNSYFNSVQTYNGVDQIENETQNLFDNNTEYKISFEGLFNIQQIIDLKNQLQKSNPDIVVSDIKLSPLTTLINDKLLEQINNELQ